jgi:DNA repair exonuclease SbcCD ATPase subunit
VRLSQVARESRDRAVEKLRARYAPKLARLQERIRAAEEKFERERASERHETIQTAVSLGATVLGALFGRKVASVGTIGRATTAARGASRRARRQQAVERASDRVEELQEQLEALEAEFDEKAADVAAPVDPSSLDVEEYLVRPRKSDIQVEPVALVWTPWGVSPEGIAEPLF